MSDVFLCCRFKGPAVLYGDFLGFTIILHLQEPEEAKKSLGQEEKTKKLKSKISKLQAELDRLTEELKILTES